MGNTNIITPLTGKDSLLGEAEPRIAHQPAASSNKTGSHGDVVVEALSVPVRFLIAGVLLFNLTLGVWLVGRSDFSEVKPQGLSKDAARASATATPMDSKGSIHGSEAGFERTLDVATANERN